MRKLAKLIGAAVIVAAVATVQAQLSFPLGKLVYIDATDTAQGNTETFTNGVWTVWEAFNGQTWSANDGIWDRREFGNTNTINPIYGTTRTIYQNAASGQVDTNATRLRTTVTLPDPGENRYYEIYALYWSDPSGWRIGASLTDDPGQLPLYIHAPGMSSVQLWPNGPGGENDHPDVGTRWSHELPENPFTTSVMVSEGNRRLLMTPSLGSIYTGGPVSVYIEPDRSQPDSNARTWYDGIAVQLVPEPTAWALMGLGALVAILRFRRNRN